MSYKGKLIIAASFFLLIGAGIALGMERLINHSSADTCELQELQFVNCELAHERRPVIAKHEYVALKTRLEQLIQSRIKDGTISNAAVYFRDLKSGPTMGIKEDSKFIPASLLKVPVLLTYLRLAEEDPDILKKELAYRGKDTGHVVMQQFLPYEEIKPNVSYTIDELLKRMTAYSDNKAYEGLINYLKVISPDKDLVADTIIDLGITNPISPENEVVTVKSYSSLFRLLYNVSFLETREMSAKALSYLVDVKFPYGITGSIPEDIKVANKFGERSMMNSDSKQLHDCGIVYYPENPYLICIMTKGKNYESLSDIIREISKMVYEEVDSRRIE